MGRVKKGQAKLRTLKELKCDERVYVHVKIDGLKQGVITLSCGMTLNEEIMFCNNCKDLKNIAKEWVKSIHNFKKGEYFTYGDENVEIKTWVPRKHLGSVRGVLEHIFDLKEDDDENN